jgi:hypothetical protein
MVDKGSSGVKMINAIDDKNLKGFLIEFAGIVANKKIGKATAKIEDPGKKIANEVLGDAIVDQAKDKLNNK